MPNPLAVIGDSIKAAVPKVNSLPWATYGGKNAISTSYVGYMPDGLVERGLTFGGGSGAPYDYDKIAGEPLNNSVVASAVLAYGKALSQAPPILQNLVNGKWVDVNDHDALDLLQRPNKHLDPFDFDYANAAWKLTRGRATWVVFVNNAGAPAELWPWHPHKSKPFGSATEFIAGYEVQAENGDWKNFSSEQVIDFRYMPNLHNLREGSTPLDTGRRQMVGFDASAEYHTAILLNAGMMSLLISLKQGDAQGQEVKVTPEQFETFLNALRRKYIGNKQAAGGIDGLNLPLEIQKMAYSPDEMAIKDLLAIFEGHLCALMDIDPAIVRYVGGSAEVPYSNLGTIERAFAERSVVPMKQRDAGVLTRQWLPFWFNESELKKWRVAYDYSQVKALQENQGEVHKMWRESFAAGAIDLFTFQAKIGQPDIPDTYKDLFAKPLVKLGDAPPKEAEVAPVPAVEPQGDNAE